MEDIVIKYLKIHFTPVEDWSQEDRSFIDNLSGDELRWIHSYYHESSSDLDAIASWRCSLVEAAPTVISYGKKLQKEKKTKMPSLFGDVEVDSSIQTPDIKELHNISLEHASVREREHLGLSLNFGAEKIYPHIIARWQTHTFDQLIREPSSVNVAVVVDFVEKTEVKYSPGGYQYMNIYRNNGGEPLRMFRGFSKFKNMDRSWCLFKCSFSPDRSINVSAMEKCINLDAVSDSTLLEIYCTSIDAMRIGELVNDCPISQGGIETVMWIYYPDGTIQRCKMPMLREFDDLVFLKLASIQHCFFSLEKEKSKVKWTAPTESDLDLNIASIESIQPELRTDKEAGQLAAWREVRNWG